MAPSKFDPRKPSGIAVDDSNGTRWITQGAWKYHPVTKELLPGQLPEQSLAPPQAPAWMGGGIETPDLPEGVTDPGAAPRDPVTLEEEVIYKNINGEVKTPAEEVTAIAPRAALRLPPRKRR